MTTIRLYRAIKEKQDAQAVYDAARFNGNYGPPKNLPHSSPLVLKLREAQTELQAAMQECEGIMKCSEDRQHNVLIRIAGEQDICRFMMQNLAEQGYELSGTDGEEEFDWTTDWKELYANAFETDDFQVYVRGGEKEDDGWIRLVYGNSPAEMISDYTTNLEKSLNATFKYIRSYYDQTYIIKGE